MIRHIVLFRLRADVPAERCESCAAALAGLRDSIPEIRSIEVVRDEIGSERSATFGLVSEFDSFDALRHYQEHPDHLTTIGWIRPLCEWIHALDYTVDAGHA